MGVNITLRDRHLVPAFVTKDTSIIREILAPRNTEGVVVRQSLAEATLPVGAVTQAHRHPNTEELYYILTGTGEMRIEAVSQSVKPGEGIAIPAGMAHQIRNTGVEPLVFFCCCVPAYSDDDTVMLTDKEIQEGNWYS